MTWRRQSKAEDETTDGVEPTPAGVGLAAGYGYPETAKAHGKSNGGDIRRAYKARFEPLFRRDLRQ
jgi:hypothetical protein